MHHSINGSFSIRQGQWKLELCPDSGGWSEPRPAGGGKGKAGAKGKAAAAKAKSTAASLPPIQLYDLGSDIGEKVNVQAEHPDVVERLTKLLEKYVTEGRSTPGAAQKNTVDPDIGRYSKGK